MHPDVQGVEATVTDRTYSKSRYGADGKEYGEGWSYKTDQDHNFPNPGSLNWWFEASLRKRPSDMSFDDLMESFKIPEEELA